MKVFIYSTSDENGSIWMVFAADRADADQQMLDGELGGDPEDLEDLDCAEYGEPDSPGSYVLKA